MTFVTGWQVLLLLGCVATSLSDQVNPGQARGDAPGQDKFELSSRGQASAPARAPVRGVWVSPNVGREAATGVPQIQQTLDRYAAAGIDTVILLVKDTAGYVYYKSEIGVADPAWEYDFLGVWLREAHKRNIAVHAWFCVFNEGAVLGKTREHLEWFVTNRAGERTGVLNPALPEVRQYELSLMSEVARRYPVDWIHLDYIRFPCMPAEPYFSFDPQTRKLFKEHAGFDPLEIKAQDSGNVMWNEWLDWNREQVTQFVRELRAALRTMERPVQISAAVFPEADNARVLIGQDWPRWAELGLVDMLCPMIYTNHAGFFEKLTLQAVAHGKGRCLVCPGIGIGTSHNQNTPAGMLEQMRISEESGADGVIYFSGGSLNERFLDRLKAEK